MNGALVFEAPLWLVLVPLALWPLRGEIQKPRLLWALDSVSAKPVFSMRVLLARACLALRPLAALAMIGALAQPAWVGGTLVKASNGIAIVLAFDRSLSMAEPLGSEGESSRLEAARGAALAFLDGRPSDLIGVDQFANWPDTLCPPTLDHAFVREVIEAIQLASRAEPGTNLGDAIAWSLKTLRETEARRRVIVLITDGRNEPDRSLSHDPLDPSTAATLARDFGVVIHTIGIAPAGSEAELDAALLGELAQTTGGRFFQVGSPEALRAVFEELDRLEPGRVESRVVTRTQPLAGHLLAAAMGALGLDWLFRRSSLAPLPGAAP